MLATMSTALRALALPALLSLGLGLAGCGAACNHANLCAVTGMGDNLEVCDGNGFRPCNDGDRGLAIGCATRPEQAVCTPNGWAFQPTSPPPQSQSTASDGGQ
jgi:hypothetical protein